MPRLSRADSGSASVGPNYAVHYSAAAWPLALRQAVAEVRQDLLGDRRHVGARHVVRQGAELGLGQRGVEAGEVLVLGELLAHRVRAADDDDAGS